MPEETGLGVTGVLSRAGASAPGWQQQGHLHACPRPDAAYGGRRVAPKMPTRYS